jgi:hypothetical protein
VEADVLLDIGALVAQLGADAIMNQLPALSYPIHAGLGDAKKGGDLGEGHEFAVLFCRVHRVMDYELGDGFGVA